MPRKSDLEFKSFIEQIGVLIDARAKTQEFNINMHTDAIIKDAIKDMATKQDIKDMVRQFDIKDMLRQFDIKDMLRQSDIKDMATRQDIARLEKKIDETKSLKILVEELRKRLDKLEAELAVMK